MLHIERGTGLDASERVVYEDRPRPELSNLLISGATITALGAAGAAWNGIAFGLPEAAINAVLTAAFLAFWWHSPWTVRYQLTSDTLEVRWGFLFKRTLALGDIRSVALGRYSVFGLGRLPDGSRVYAAGAATNRRDGVYVRKTRSLSWPVGSFWITPSDPEEFLRVLEAQRGVGA